MIHVALFEDHPVVLNSLQTVLNYDNRFKLVFGVSTKNDFIEMLDFNNNIDVVVLDLLAEDVIGFELYEFVKLQHPKVKMISFTSLSSPILIESLLELGVKGYVNKKQPTNQLLEAIVEVNDGKISLPADYVFMKNRENDTRTTLLTDREIEVTRLIFNEFTNNDIAETLNISVSTVESHRRRIFEKLNVKNIAGLIREATKMGYIS